MHHSRNYSISLSVTTVLYTEEGMFASLTPFLFHDKLFQATGHIRSKASLFGIVTRPRAARPNNRGSINGTDKKFFFSPQCPGQFWDSIHLPLNGERTLFCRRYSGCSEKLSNYVHLTQVLRVLPLPNTSFWQDSGLVYNNSLSTLVSV